MVVGIGGNLIRFATPAVMTGSTEHTTVPRSSLHMASLPLFFEPNQGQTDSRVKFLARGSGYGLFLTEDEAVLELRHSPSVETQLAGSRPTKQRPTNGVIRMRLDGANGAARVSGTQPLPGKSNYFIGNDPTKWRRGIPQFAAVSYESVYPGIDLVYYGSQEQLEYDFHVAPGADPGQIVLRFDGASAHLDSGDLVLSTDEEDVRFHAPRVYQPDGPSTTGEKLVSGRFRQLADGRIGFMIGDYDRNRELVIDPVLSYSSYLGGSGSESNVQVAVDIGANIYVAGSTTSVNDFPLPASPPAPPPLQTSLNGSQNLFIAKINPSAAAGQQLLYATYLGGNGSDLAAGVAVDSSLNIYVAGTTSSTNFPTTSNAFRTTVASGTHGFVSKLGLNGSNYVLAYSTYLAGNGSDAVTGLAIDTKQDAFVTGITTSTDQADTTIGFPANLNGFQQVSQGTSQFFASKINTLGSGFTSMLYSTYFGGGNPAGATTIGGGVALDPSGNMYITGTTNFLGVAGVGPAFPLRNAQQTCLDQAGITSNCINPGPTAVDAFVAKFNPNLPNDASLVYSTFLGGSDNDFGRAIAVDSASDAYVTGETFSSDWNARTNSYAAAGDAYVAKIINPTSGQIYPLTTFTYIGGSGEDDGRAIAVDSAQATHIAGFTNSAGIGVNQLQGYAGNTDAFAALHSTTSAAGDYFTYLGGGNLDQGTAVALDSNNDSSPTVVAGITQSGDFPPFNPFQSTLRGPQDAFVAKIGAASTFAYATNSPSVSPNPATVGVSTTFTFAFTNAGPDAASNVIFIGTLPPTTSATFSSASATPGGSCPSPVNATLTCSVGAVPVGSTATITITLTPVAGATNLIVSPSLSVNGGAFTTFTAATVSVNDFTISASPSSVMTVAGNNPPTPYVVTLTPTSPTNTFGTVSLSVSSTINPAAAGTTFTFTSSSVTLSGSSPVTTTLNFTTTARPVTTAALRYPGRFYAAVLPIGGLSLMGLGLGVGWTRRRWLIAGAFSLILGVVILQPACSSSSSSTTTTTGGTPAGTYTITISAASGAASHTVPVTLNVQ